jgi:hypothetical protein
MEKVKVGMAAIGIGRGASLQVTSRPACVALTLALHTRTASYVAAERHKAGSPLYLGWSLRPNIVSPAVDAKSAIARAALVVHRFERSITPGRSNGLVSKLSRRQWTHERHS